MTRTVLCSLALTLSLLSSELRAQVPDWNALAAEDTIELLTHDADGDPRETTVWMGVVNGQAYVRTSDTRWRANLDRDANVVVRVAEQEYPSRAELVTDSALRARVDVVFRAKYGFTDRMLGWFGNDGGKVCFALVARPASP